MSSHISVITPVYGCKNCLKFLYESLVTNLSLMTNSFEIIMVNDSSPDGAWEIIVELARKDSRVKGINLTRNFGQHYAISAGLDYASGDWIVIMDCDLQDNPEEIPKLYEKAKEGFDIVVGVSEYRATKNILYNLIKSAYYKLQDYFLKNEYETINFSFVMLSKNVRDNFIRLREQTRHVSVLLRLIVGNNIAKVNVSHQERVIGKSSYTLRKKINLAIDGIVSYSLDLLKIAIFMGFLISLFAFLFAFYIIYRTFLTVSPLPGWASIIVSILFSTGILLMMLGILGIYMEKIFLDVKGRPLYFVKESVNI